MSKEPVQAFAPPVLYREFLTLFNNLLFNRMRLLLLLAICLIPIRLFAQNQVKEVSAAAVDLENCQYELGVVSKQLRDVRNQAKSELKPLQDRISSQEKELEAYRKEIASLKAKNEDLHDKYSRLQASSDATIQSGRVGTVDGSSRSGSYHATSSYRTSQARTYYTGPRGGCYYLTGSGRKQYVDRSLCN
ncbi:hypothetical protein [Spirosoma agri]